MDMALKEKLIRLSKKEYFWIILLTLLVLAMHFAILYQPSTIILDEVYYVDDARDIVKGDLTIRAEHPPLGELMIAAGIVIFGDNPLGWRFFVIIFGSAAIFLVYVICRQLHLSRRTSFLAAFLLALENLTFTQSSVAMLDVFPAGLMLLSFWLYLRRNYPLASVSGSLSVLTKLTGAVTFLAIGLHWIIARRDRRIFFILSAVLAPLLFLELLPLFDFLAKGDFINPITRIQNMISMSSQLTFEKSSHPFATRPWEWVIFLRTMPYYYDPDYLAVISPSVWALIIPSVGYMAYKVKKGSGAALFGLVWFASTYIVWLPLQYFTDRMTYVYYFYPAVGSVCIGIAIALNDLYGLWERRKEGKLRWVGLVSFCFYLLVHVAFFVVLSPVFKQWIPPVRDFLF